MKNTGIIRKIDDLGRIVLPKELRKSLNVNSGDDFEITIDNNKIILEKFSRLESYEDIIKRIINCFLVSNNLKIFVTIDDKIINYNKESITSTISKVILSRKVFINDKIDKITISNNLIFNGRIVIYPIVINSDLLGSIIMIGDEDIKLILDRCKILYNMIKNIIFN